MLITIQLLLRLNVYNDQAEAMKALDGKKDLRTADTSWLF